MSTTPQEPGEELKRLVAEIIDKAYFATGLPTHDGREERFRQIEREAALKIENYIQSRIPEVSEEAREFEELLADAYQRDQDGFQNLEYEEIVALIAARDKALVEKWREVLEKYLEANTGSFSTTIDGREQRFEYEAKARALLSEKS